MNYSDLSWQPLYTSERGGITELAVTGIIAVADTEKTESLSRSSDRLLVRQGDVDYPLWTRSLLKPFQLVSHLQILQNAYPQLKPEHYALMSSSHSGEELHLNLLREIIEIGGVPAEHLLCPPAWPGDVCTRERFKAEGKTQLSLFHNCSGKHLSYLMSLKAQGKTLSEYTAFTNSEHLLVENLLAEMLNRAPDSFHKTTDGCQLPNFAMSVREMAELYRQLAYAAGQEDDDSNGLKTVGNLMNRYPKILGGSHRLDSKIMAGGLTTGNTARLIAKDGADGLLAIGVLPTERFKNGVGIVIKVSSGYDIRHMEILASRVLDIIGLHEYVEQTPAATGVRTDHVETNFSFGLNRKSSTRGELV